MIQLKNVTLRRGAKVVLDGVSATLNPGEHVGLVGRNGAGKSSLFALLAGHLHEDGGDFFLPSQWRMAQVAQDMPETCEAATAFVLAGDSQLATLQQRLAAAQEQGDGMAIAQLHADLHDAGAHDAVARAQTLILGLGFQPGQLDAPVNSFSGGWRMRLQLARALMAPSDLLLLDEPTNHLDLDALVWLEAWLKRYAGTLIVISHDREFLDAVTDVTLHIENAQLTRYGGNYSRFEELRAQQILLQQAAYERQQDKIAHLQSFIDRFKAKATKAKQAQSRVKQIERMEKIAPVLASADFTFTFREPANLPNPMLAITDAAFGYPAEGEAAPSIILRGVSRSVLAGQRIGILGANGQGKSTLVKTIARELGADAKEPSREQDLRNFLGGFNFSGDMVRQSVGTMSGGEKARLVLAMIVWQRPNLLLLDEPTNHLDLATREALAMALNDFDGTVMLVSHDRALLRSVCEDFWLVGRGGVGPFDGDLDDYQRYLLEESRRLREAARSQADSAPASAPRASSAPNGREQRKASAQARQQLAEKTRPLRRELAQLDSRLAVLGQEKTQLEERLSSPLPPAEIADCGRRLKACGDEIEQLEERWLELGEAIEAIETAMTGD